MVKSKDKSLLKTIFSTNMGPAILTCLTTFSVSYMTLIANGKSIPINFKGFSISKDVQFILFLSISIFFIFLCLRSIKNAIVSYRDSKQEEYMFAMFSKGNYEQEFIFKADNKTEDTFVFEVGYSNDMSSVYITRIDGPFCGVSDKDEEGLCFSELVVSKTFLGRYVYSCDRCGNKMKSPYSESTLSSKMERLAFTDIKKEFKKTSRNGRLGRY